MPGVERDGIGNMDLFNPSTTSWRRERLLRVGSTNTVPTLAQVADTSTDIDTTDVVRENSPLRAGDSRSYGTLPMPRRNLLRTASFRIGRRNPDLPKLNLSRTSLTTSNPASPMYTPSVFREFVHSQRPISAYDQTLVAKDSGVGDFDAKLNGIRVWYSSFSSIDWMHDAIKDSLRFSKLRRRKSLRARARLAFDKSLGWIIVTIVGFFTAVVAFLVVRMEQLLFDLKEGYCTDNWTTAKRFCCPQLDESIFLPDATNELECPAWKQWSEIFSWKRGESGENIVEYVTYAIVALTLAFMSCVLTLYLTNSTTFVTRKESGVLASDFKEDLSESNDNTKINSPEPKRRVMYYAAGSGIPEIKTILSGFVIHGYLGGRVLFTKSIGLALSVASGLSLGKEGPFVHIASCIGNIVSRFSSKYELNEAKRREILSAACAAGVAVAFGAPIGGTLFSLEEVSYYFPPKVMWRSFFCAMIAAITLKALDPFGTGKLVLFQVTYDMDWHGWELLPFLFLGVFGGLYGAYFSKLNHRWSRDVRNKTWLKTHPILEVLLVTLLTTALCFLNPYTRMGGTELVYNLLAECRTGSGNNHSGLCVVDPGAWIHVWPVVRAILVALLVKGFLTVITFGIKVPAGIFIPTLGVGACAGRVLGIWMQWLQVRNPDARIFKSCNGDLDCIIPGLYAMVGAAATLSGVTRTTVSLAVIMFELTDTLTYVVPVMMSVLVAKTVADALEPKGIYDLVIELSQLPFLDVKEEYIWGHWQINDVTNRDVPVIQLDQSNTVTSLVHKLQILIANGNSDGGFPILRKVDDEVDEFRMVGYIGANELEHALSIVADEPQGIIHFQTTYTHDFGSSSISSFMDANPEESDPFDFSIYMDQAPLKVQSNSPLEMVHQFFAKLGARYVVINDPDGYYEGVIDKKTWLVFISGLEEK